MYFNQIVNLFCLNYFGLIAIDYLFILIKITKNFQGIDLQLHLLNFFIHFNGLTAFFLRINYLFLNLFHLIVALFD